MKAHVASLINALALMGFGYWGYSVTEAKTALIPVVAGALLLAMNAGVKKENKVIAHIAVLITLLMVFGLIKPLIGGISDGDTIGIVRVAIMLITTILAMVAFVRSFIAARKAREAGE